MKNTHSKQKTNKPTRTHTHTQLATKFKFTSFNLQHLINCIITILRSPENASQKISQSCPRILHLLNNYLICHSIIFLNSLWLTSWDQKNNNKKTSK